MIVQRRRRTERTVGRGGTWSSRSLGRGSGDTRVTCSTGCSCYCSEVGFRWKIKLEKGFSLYLPVGVRHGARLGDGGIHGVEAGVER